MARFRLLTKVCLGALAVAVAVQAEAQEAIVTASVFVVPGGYEVVKQSDLDFGTLVPGQETVVDHDATAAGRWTSGPFARGKHEVTLTIYTPDTLLRLEGGSSIPVDWNGEFARVRGMETGVEEVWNPTSSYSIEVGARPNANAGWNAAGRFGENIEVFIGGRIDANAFVDSPAGSYTGSLRLTVVPIS